MVGKNICFMAFAYPWFFGPYGNQILKLSKKFLEIGYEVSFLSLAEALPKKTYSYKELMNNDSDIKLKLDSETKITLSKITFLGGITKMSEEILISSINEVLEHFNISTLIALMDLRNLVEDTTLKCKSLIWYPNHFNPPTNYTLSKLRVFSHIISLCETDCELLKNYLPDKNVEYIPHIIEFDEPKDSINLLRKKYGVPENAFVVLINCGNYELQNRKSLDTSIFGFEEFSNKYDNVFLYIHAYNIKNLNNKNNLVDIKQLLNVEDVLSHTTIPESKYKLNEEIMEYSEILELFKMSDVLLQGSKTEGFGIPVIEAQLLGKPVVTTKFGAMMDYTYYGISVPPAQKYYEISSRGIMALPSISGNSDALDRIYNNNFSTNDKKEYAINKIKQNMCTDSVAQSFQKIIEEEWVEEIFIDSSNETISTLIYDTQKKILLLDDKKKKNIINVTDLSQGTEWVICSYGSMNQNKFMIKGILNGITNDDIPNIICLKTKYLDGKIYPTEKDLVEGNINERKISYILNAKIFKLIIHDNSIEHKFLIQYIFNYALKFGNIKLAPMVLCEEF